MSASLPFAAAASRLILPKTVRSRLYHWFLNRRIEQLPSRRYLDEAIFPTLAEIGCRSVLFAGVRSYNRRCLDACRERGIAVWTIDIDPTVAQLGAPGHHIVGDLCSIDRLAPHLAVDATIVNGIFGYGVDTAEQAEAAVAAITNVTRAGGSLIVGWNPARAADYREAASSKLHLCAISLGRLPPRTEFPPDRVQSDWHVYDVYQVIK